MNDLVSKRVVEQRVRNRICECLDLLAMGDEAVRLLGAPEYFNRVDDWVRRDEGTFGLSTLSATEKVALTGILDVLDAAASETSPHVTEAELITSGWPQRIALNARQALDVFARRGAVFSEDMEEAEPGVSAR